MAKEEFEPVIDGQTEESKIEHAGYDAHLNFEKIIWIQLHRSAKALSMADLNTWNCVNTLADLLLAYQDREYDEQLKKLDSDFNKEITNIKSQNIENAKKNYHTQNERLNLAGKKFKAIMELLSRQKLLLRGKFTEEL